MPSRKWRILKINIKNMDKFEQEKVLYQKFKDAITVLDLVMNNSSCKKDFDDENKLKAFNYVKRYLSALIEPQKERLED